ncbi:MAG: nitrophenyl compound nitroreductase subunit ArsF family protein [Candidatus Altiarchaeota archaeon]
MKSRKRSENSSKNSGDRRRPGSLPIIAFMALVAILVAAAMTPRGGEPAAATTTTTIRAVEKPVGDVKVEIYHFHRTSQCWSCKTLGALAEKTVNTHFKDEMESGRLTFGRINVELAQNAEITERYGAAGSSLMIGTYQDGRFTMEEDTRVWYKLNDEKEYMGYLKGVLERRLAGDLS